MIKKCTIILGVIGSDCHAVGNKILERVFADGGFHVVNLGTMVSQQEFVDAAIETDARAILISSLYGQGELDCEGMRSRCIEMGLDDILLYVGGNLVIGRTDRKIIEEKYKAMGYDRVFTPDADLQDAVQLLKNDIAQRELSRKIDKNEIGTKTI